MKRLEVCSGSKLNRRFLKPLSLVLVLSALTVVLAEPADTDSLLERNRKIAQAYADSAFSSYIQNKTEEALSLAEAAISFDATNSDALVVKYFVLAKSSVKARELVTLLQTALLSDTFKNFFHDDIAYRLARQLIRVRDAYEAVKLADTLLYAPYRLSILAFANLELGNLDKARDLFSAYIRTNISNIEAVIPLLMRLRNEPYNPAHAEFIQYVSSVLLPYVRFEHPELLPALIPFALDNDTARLLIREYRVYNHYNAYCSLYAYQYGLIPFSTLVDELFSNGTMVPYEVYESVFSNIPDPESQAQLVKKLSSWSGVVYTDENYDGIPETTLEFQQGLPAYLVADRNQDGEAELDCLFRDGLPEKIAMYRAGGYISVMYYRWPQVRTVLTEEALSGLREYRYVPGALNLPLITQTLLLQGAPLLTGLWYRVPVQLPVPAPDMLARSALEIVKRQGSSSSISQLSQGYPYFASGNNGTASYLAYYDTGFPIAEKVDIDGDGVFEGRRYYIRNKDGVPVPSELRIDDDQNGVVEYIERYTPVITKIWDIDQDGLPDIAITNEGAGVERYEAALTPTGLMDLVIYAKNGIPYRVLYRDQDLPLIPDTNPRVIWIGKKYFDFGVKTPSQGWSIFNGNRYYVLAAGGYLFVQAMNGF